MKKRIFTEEMEKALIKLAEISQKYHTSQHYKFMDILILLGGFVTNNYLVVFNFSKIKDKLYSLANNAELNVTTLNIKKGKIKESFKNIRNEDKRVGKNLDGLTSYAKAYEDLINEFEFIMDRKNISFNSEKINNHLANAIKDFDDFEQNKYKKYIGINDKDPFLKESAYISNQYLNGINVFTTVLMAWKNKSKIIASYIRDLWNALIENRKVSWESFNESKIKSSIKSVLDTYAEQEDKDYVKYTKKANEYISLIKKCKTLAEYENLEEFKKNKDLKKLLDKLGGFDKVWSIAKECPQVLEELLSNYEKQKEAFSLIKKTYRDDADYYRVVEELEREYNNKFYIIAEKIQESAFDEYAKQGIAYSVQIFEKIITEIFGKAYTGGAGGLFNVITASIDIVIYATGGDSWANNALDFCYYQQNNTMYEAIYNEYRDKISSGKYTEKDVERMKIAFKMMKQNLLKMYECYFNMCKDPDEKAEIQRRIIEIQSMEAPLV